MSELKRRLSNRYRPVSLDGTFSAILNVRSVYDPDSLVTCAGVSWKASVCQVASGRPVSSTWPSEALLIPTDGAFTNSVHRSEPARVRLLCRQQDVEQRSAGPTLPSEPMLTLSNGI